MKKNYLLKIVEKELERRIMVGKYKPGQRIIEREIADELNVSRTPIREAIRGLEKKGLVSVVPRKGAIVVNLNMSDMKELYEMRSVLEGLACRIAIENITEKNIEELHETQEIIDTCLKKREYKKLDKYNAIFHFNIYKVSHRPRLINEITSLWNHVKLMRIVTLGAQGREESIRKEHYQILELLRKKDGESLEKQIRRHVMNAAEYMIKSGFFE